MTHSGHYGIRYTDVDFVCVHTNVGVQAEGTVNEQGAPYFVITNHRPSAKCAVSQQGHRSHRTSPSISLCCLTNQGGKQSIPLFMCAG